MKNLTIISETQNIARVKGSMLALLGAFLMSSDSIFVRYSGVKGFDTAFLFGLFTTISMLVAIQLWDKRGLLKTFKDSGWPLLISGLLMLVSVVAFVLSVKTTSIANTYVILSTAPAFAAVFSRVLIGEVTSRATWTTIAFVALGVFVVTSGSLESGKIAGDLLALVAVLSIALNQTILRKYPEVSRMASVGVGGFFLALAMYGPASPSTFSPKTWLIMAIMGMLTAPFGRVVGRVATRYITAPEAGLVAMLDSVFAPLLAFLFFREVPSTTTLTGGAIILTSILLYLKTTLRLGGSQLPSRSYNRARKNKS